VKEERERVERVADGRSERSLRSDPRVDPKHTLQRVVVLDVLGKCNKMSVKLKERRCDGSIIFHHYLLPTGKL
jgi:hypothetical protein